MLKQFQAISVCFSQSQTGSKKHRYSADYSLCLYCEANMKKLSDAEIELLVNLWHNEPVLMQEKRSSDASANSSTYRQR